MKKIDLTYESEFSFAEDTEPLIIRGQALHAGEIPSKKLIIPEEELDRLVESLKQGEDGRGAYLLTDHQKSVEKVLGRVTDAWREGNAVWFEASVFDPQMASKIQNRLVTLVSTGLEVERQICSICGQDYLSGGCKHVLGRVYDGKTASIVARGLRGREISLVLFPADKHATLEFQLSRVAETLEKEKIVMLNAEEFKRQKREEVNKEKEKRESDMVNVVELTEEELSQHPFVKSLIDLNAENEEKIKRLEEEKEELTKKVEELTERVRAFEEAEKARAEERRRALVAELIEKRKEAGLPEKKPEDYANLSEDAIKEMIEMVESLKTVPPKGRVDLQEGESKEELKKTLRKKLGWM